MFSQRKSKNKIKTNAWARPGMKVTFRAELMPGLSASERTFQVKSLLANNRVTLHDFEGEHFENEFEPLQILPARS
jgi:hypothetical protein